MIHDTGPDAVLFDMDGTLVDSEPLWDAALNALAARHGGQLSDQARLAIVGRDAADSMRVFYQDLGITTPDPAADNRFLGERMAELLATRLTWRPGARALVAQVRAAGLPTALVTSTRRQLVDIVLDSTLGRDSFQVVVCGDDVGRTKPDPEPYRTAAARLGVPIHRCVAIEDTPTGMASALTAGAVVLGVTGVVPLDAVAGATVVPTLATVDLPYLTTLVGDGAPLATDQT